METTTVKPADAALLRAAVERWQSDASGECPKCGGGEWKMSEPPICARCGHRPIRAHEAYGRILALADVLERQELAAAAHQRWLDDNKDDPHALAGR